MTKYIVAAAAGLFLSAVASADAANPQCEMLHVQGNQIVTASGRSVWLQGVNSPSLSWSVAGDHLMEAVDAGIAWHANFIRLPLAQSMWFGKFKGQTDGGASYRGLVADVVKKCEDKGVYLMLDLHWSNGGKWEYQPSQYDLPDVLSEQFWTDVATLYANRPGILFDVYNEPKDVSWDVWQNGGDVVEGDKKYHSCGMQGIVDVVRKTGAKNIVVCGGLDWAYDLSGVLKGHELKDPTGNGIAYSSHIYEWKKDWDGKVLAVANLHPVIIGEVGADPRFMTEHKEDGPEEAVTWVPAMFGYIQKHHLHWAAWSMHTDASPRVVSDWDFTPTPWLGSYVRAALAGAKFECDHSR